MHLGEKERKKYIDCVRQAQNKEKESESKVEIKLENDSILKIVGKTKNCCVWQQKSNQIKEGIFAFFPLTFFSPISLSPSA